MFQLNFVNCYVFIIFILKIIFNLKFIQVFLRISCYFNLGFKKIEVFGYYYFKGLSVWYLTFIIKIIIVDPIHIINFISLCILINLDFIILLLRKLG